jgi:hypothetical protein
LAPRHELHSIAEPLIIPSGLYWLGFSQDLANIQRPEGTEVVATGWSRVPVPVEDLLACTTGAHLACAAFIPAMLGSTAIFALHISRPNNSINRCI